MRKYGGVVLALSFLSGLLIGCVFARLVMNFLSQTQQPISFRHTPAVVFIVSALSPFLFSAVAVAFSKPQFLLLICFGKAIAFGFYGFYISLIFADGAWLARCLLLFTDACMMPALYLYWLRHISGEVVSSWTENAVFISAAFLVSLFDYIFVVPIWGTLIKN